MLELYRAEGCPYSKTVLEKMTELGLSYVVHNPRRHGGDVQNEQTHDELLALGGGDQIPFLVDQQRGMTIGELVDYLDEQYGYRRIERMPREPSLDSDREGGIRQTQSRCHETHSP